MSRTNKLAKSVLTVEPIMFNDVVLTGNPQKTKYTIQNDPSEKFFHRRISRTILNLQGSVASIDDTRQAYNDVPTTPPKNHMNSDKKIATQQINEDILTKETVTPQEIYSNFFPKRMIC